MSQLDGRTVLILVAVGGLVLGWFASIGLAFRPGTEAAARPLVPWQDAAAVKRGRVLYAVSCASCHGAHGEGQTVRPAGVPQSVPLAPPHDGTGHTWQHPDFSLFQLTKEGISTVTCRTLDEKAMPKFENALTDREILDVLAFLKAGWPAGIREQQEEVNALYAKQNAAFRRQVMLGQ